MVDDGSPRDEFEADDAGEVQDHRDQGRLNASDERIANGRLIAIAGILGLAVFAGFLIYAWVATSAQGPHKGLEGVVLLVAGFVTVGILLYLGTLIFRALDMGAPREALGMPEGSIRALIAMSLILIFAIIGVQVFSAGLGGEQNTSSGVTEAQIQALRADGAQIISQTLISPVPASPAPALYTVTTRSAMTEDAHDFGLQLMTTVSTLVVAVAGFYFGSRAVTEGSATAKEQLRLTRSFSNRRRQNVVGPQPEPDAAGDDNPVDEPLEDEVAEAFDEAPEPGERDVDTASEAVDGASEVVDAEAPDVSGVDEGNELPEADTIVVTPDDEPPRRADEP